MVLGAGYLDGVFNKSVTDNFRIPNTGSQDAYDLLDAQFQSQNGATEPEAVAAGVTATGEDGVGPTTPTPDPSPTWS